MCYMHHARFVLAVAQSDVRTTGDQEVAGSILTGSSNILSWRLIMEYFLWSFSLWLIQEGQLSNVLVNR